MLRRHIVLALALVLLTAGAARADLNIYLRHLAVGAEADLGGFRAQMGAHFGVSGSQIDLVFRSVTEPGHAALCLWLSQQSHLPIEVVLHEYRNHRNEGWGALAQSLGIKPGSAAFHALKRGDLGWQPASASGGKSSGKAKGNGNGKAKGNGKGH